MISADDVRAWLLAGLAKQSQGNKSGPRPSNAGACVRKIWYDWVRTEGEESEESLLSPLVGSGLHHVFESSLKAALGSGLITEAPIEIDAGRFKIPGHADGVFPETVIDLKCVGFKTWKSIKNKPKQDHGDQINLYAWSCDKPNAAVIYVNAIRLLGIAAKHHWRDGWSFETAPRVLETRIHNWETDHTLAMKTVGKFEDVNRHVIEGEPPARPYENPTKFPCGWCEYRSTCWQDA